MIKGIATAAKKAGLDDAAFHQYWKETHGPLALQMTNLRRYVAVHPADEGYNRRILSNGLH